MANKPRLEYPLPIYSNCIHCALHCKKKEMEARQLSEVVRMLDLKFNNQGLKLPIANKGIQQMLVGHTEFTEPKLCPTVKW